MIKIVMNDKQPYCIVDFVNSFDRLHVCRPVTMVMVIMVTIY